MVKVFVRVFGKTMNSHKNFLDDLMFSPKIHEVNSEEDCDVILVFVPIVSRAGTDIDAALQQINEGRHVVLVVLHHTFDREFVVPARRENVRRKNVFTVDCLFHEDQGLLRCWRNEDALKEVKKHLKAEDSSPESRASENKAGSPDPESAVTRNEDALKEVKKPLKAEDSSPESRASENKGLSKKALLGAVAVAGIVIVIIVVVCLVTQKK